MLEIELPPSRQVGQELLSAADVIDRVLLSQPIWRERAHLAHGLSIIDKTRAPAKKVRVSEAELESLTKSCELPGLQVSPPALNHFFLVVVAAIYAAKPVSEESPNEVRRSK